jgi:hypothetical protein
MQCFIEAQIGSSEIGLGLLNAMSKHTVIHQVVEIIRNHPFLSVRKFILVNEELRLLR